MPGWTDLFPVLKKISEQFQGRIERLKNEKARIEEELIRLGDKYCGEKVAIRRSQLRARLKEVNTILINNAKD